MLIPEHITRDGCILYLFLCNCDNIENASNALLPVHYMRIVGSCSFHKLCYHSGILCTIRLSCNYQQPTTVLTSWNSFIYIWRYTVVSSYLLWMKMIELIYLNSFVNFIQKLLWYCNQHEQILWYDVYFVWELLLSIFFLFL